MVENRAPTKRVGFEKISPQYRSRLQEQKRFTRLFTEESLRFTAAARLKPDRRKFFGCTELLLAGQRGQEQSTDCSSRPGSARKT